VDRLDKLATEIRGEFAAENEVRDRALSTSRELIRLCATAIRASHRNDWDDAQELLEQADGLASELGEVLEPYPQLYFAGYTRDALKELVEAHATLALSG
jgi:translin